jgi:hypothetical protein
MMKKNFKLLFNNWLKKINMRFFLSISLSCIIGLFIRYILKEYFLIDVIRDVFEPLFVLYYSFMIASHNFTRTVLVEFLIEIFKPNFMMPGGGNFPNNSPNPNFPTSSSNNFPISENNNYPVPESGNLPTWGSSFPDYSNIPSSTSTVPNPSYLPASNNEELNTNTPVESPGLRTDNLELPSYLRSPAWNFPKREEIPFTHGIWKYKARTGKGEPMDIAIPEYEDRQYIYKVIKLTTDFRAQDPRLSSEPNSNSLSKILDTLQKEGTGTDGYFEDERTFGIAKQLRKIIYNEPQFKNLIDKERDRVVWSRVKGNSTSRLMRYLAKTRDN